MKMYCLTFCLCASMLIACGKEAPYIPSGSTPGEVQVDGFQPILLSGSAAGTWEYEDGKLSLSVQGAGASWGVCLDKLCSGHFIAEAEADSEVNCGLALVQEKDGKPDYDNYVAISVCMENGNPVIRATDRQNGQDNVLDNTGTISDSDMEFRYAVPLSGTYFSVPFKSATGKVRIIRNDISGFFHLYAGVGREINGEWHEDWIETAQIKDWDSGADWFICPFVRLTTDRSADIAFDDIRFEEFPSSASGQDDGFSVAETDNLVWAGFPGDGIVVNFDEKLCPAAASGKKFVFWSESNYVPAWLMDNELLYCYEFCETWSDKVKGCFEPMSDRLLAYADVDIVEDNAVRKVVKYHYALVNPDYEAPYDDGSFPEVDEWYTFYPDGICVRRMDYIQNGTPNGRHHELAEPMAISGSSTIPSDHFKSPAFVISNLAGASYELYPDKSSFAAVSGNVPGWDEQIYRARLSDAPDVFCAFASQSRYPDVTPLPITLDLSWHDITYQMSHFPVDKQPYLNARYGDYDKSSATWPSQVSHSSLIGIEATGGCDWTSDYETDTSGRKYRTYLMLFGISLPDDAAGVDASVRAWLSAGTFRNLSGAELPEIRNGFDKREIVLNRAGTEECSFEFVPSGTVKNPVFRISGWEKTGQVSVKCNGRNLAEGTDCISEVIEGNLVIWLNLTSDAAISISVE